MKRILDFKQNNIKHDIIRQEPFVDFATSRNRGLVLTEENFPNAEFMLMLDAEWYMHGIKDLLQFCHERIEKVYS